MNLDEYMIWTDTVAQYPNRDTDLTYPVLKLVGELGEYLEAPSLDELGDVLWYLARICKVTGISLDYLAKKTLAIAERVDDRKSTESLWLPVGAIAEAVGKSIRNGKNLNDRVVVALPELMTLLHVFKRRHEDATFEDIASQNKAKLTQRLENNEIKGR